MRRIGEDRWRRRGKVRRGEEGGEEERRGKIVFDEDWGK